MEEKTVGVVLFQLGGPDSPEAVEPFLYNLFSDPDIIDLPVGRWARQPLARLAASSRAKKVQHHYAAIGGRSPIRELTERQAAALEVELGRSLRARVVVAMRYWHPLSEEAIAKLEAAGVNELVLLPLYPQYSKTTSGSSLNEWKRKYKPRPDVPVRTIHHFYDHSLYLQALVEKINLGLQSFALPENVQLVFSAHGVPVSIIEAGDPYVGQTEETVRLVLKAGGWRNPHLLCYQSKVGPGRWVQPSLVNTLRQLGRQGVRNVLVIPISFVSDHVETLNEINIEAREIAEQAGIAGFAMMPALNDSPTFITALADLVLKEVSGIRCQVSVKAGHVEPGA